jgi:tetrapyrrole methylase family protein / MazG family protein
VLLAHSFQARRSTTIENLVRSGRPKIELSVRVTPCEFFARAVEFFFRYRSQPLNVPPKRSVRKKTARNSKQGGKRGSKPARRQLAKEQGRAEMSSLSPVGKLFEDLVAIQARLRAPRGCPWDREQTHLTLRTYLIEEAYEVLDAIDKGNAVEMTEELGDLLLQVLFHADIAREAGAFDISNVVTGIHDKLVRRHPHVFGNVKADTAAQVLKNWAQLKAKEKQKALPDGALTKESPQSILQSVPRNLPALLEAYQMTRRARQVGFDWEHVEGIFEKLKEEAQELQSALASSNRRAAEEEVGDILFAAVNLARFLEIDPEVALKHSNLKFKQRFQDMEREAARRGQDLSKLSKGELEDLWEAAKAKFDSKISSGTAS